MKEQGFENSSAGPIFPRARELDAGSDRPTVVQAPLDLLAHERSPRTLPKSSLHEALLEMEQARPGASPSAVPSFPKSDTHAAALEPPPHADTERAATDHERAGGELPPGEPERPGGELSPQHRARGERLPDGKLRRPSEPREASVTMDDFEDLPEDDELGARLESDEISHVGQVIDNRYVVESLIARGGMGVVYRCRHQVIGKRFAVKIIRSNMAHLSDAPRRFLMEAKAASAIGNEHIIDIVDYGTLADGSAYLVMELLEGMPLSDLIARHETLPTRRIVKIAMQMCEGLRAAHEAGIVHRDLKPENVFLVSRRSGDFVKILDFGIAKMSMPGEPMTKKGLIVGTPHYMSPEQAAGLPVDPRGDIYSLGVILYELASGRVPFDATHYMAVLAKHMTTPPPPFGSLGLDVHLPPEFEAVVLRCLAKRPEDRFQSMAELQGALERLHRWLPPTAPLARGHLPTVDLLSCPPPPRETTTEGRSSLPPAAGRSLVAPPKRRELGLALFGVIVLGVSLLSVWRMRAEPARERAEGRVERVAPGTTPGSPHERAGGTASAKRSLEPAPSIPTPIWPDRDPAPAAKAAAPAAPERVEPPPTPTTALDAEGPMTIVELAPGRSVEIEARTRLSLRLEKETRALAEGRALEERTAEPRRPASRAAKHRRPRVEPSTSTPEAPPAEHGLMNPWPTP